MLRTCTEGLELCCASAHSRRCSVMVATVCEGVARYGRRAVNASRQVLKGYECLCACHDALQELTKLTKLTKAVVGVGAPCGMCCCLVCRQGGCMGFKVGRVAVARAHMAAAAERACVPGWPLGDL